MPRELRSGKLSLDLPWTRPVLTNLTFYFEIHPLDEPQLLHGPPALEADSLKQQIISHFSLGEKSVLMKTPCGVEIPINRDILMARSEVFAAIFSHETNEKQTNVVTIDGIKPEVLQAMARFIDEDTLHPDTLKEYAGHLLIAADRYALKRLQRLCENHLHASLDESTVIMTMELARTINSQPLKEACMNILLAQATHKDFLKQLFDDLEEQIRTKDQKKKQDDWMYFVAM